MKPIKKPNFEIDLIVDGGSRRIGGDHLSLNPDDDRILYFVDPNSMCVEEYQIDGTEIFVTTENGRHLRGKLVNG